MFSVHSAKVYLAREPVDLRKSIDGLSILVSQVLREDPFSEQLFVFINRRGDKIKLLYWERNGFVLCYKRLERGQFPWPKIAGEHSALVIEPRQLQWLLSGLAIEQRRALPAVAASTIV